MDKIFCCNITGRTGCKRASAISTNRGLKPGNPASDAGHDICECHAACIVEVQRNFQIRQYPLQRVDKLPHPSRRRSANRVTQHQCINTDAGKAFGDFNECRYIRAGFMVATNRALEINWLPSIWTEHQRHQTTIRTTKTLASYQRRRVCHIWRWSTPDVDCAVLPFWQTVPMDKFWRTRHDGVRLTCSYRCSTRLPWIGGRLCYRRCEHTDVHPGTFHLPAIRLANKNY